jgi:hypothetical protein
MYISQNFHHKIKRLIWGRKKKGYSIVDQQLVCGERKIKRGKREKLSLREFSVVWSLSELVCQVCDILKNVLCF